MSFLDVLNKPLTLSPRLAKTDARPPRGKVETGGVPRVNLMPPSVEADRRMRRGVRLAGLAVVVSLIIGGAGIGASFYSTMQSTAALVTENQRTADLLASQTEYADTAAALADIDRVQGAQAVVGAQDVQWAPYITELGALLPEGASFSNVAIRASTPLSPLASADGADATAVVDPTVTATGTFTIRTRNLADVDTWIKRLPETTGYRVATVGAIANADGVYDAAVTVAIGDEVLSHLYDTDGGASDGSSARSATSATTTGSEN